MIRIIALALFCLGNILTTVQAQESSDRSVLHPASYWKTYKDSSVQCFLCPRRCVIASGQRGFCTVRMNKGGKLYSLGYANPVAIHIDPIEKKPFFHVSPGASVYSLAVAGCNMRCVFCQNWQISQSKPDEAQSYELSPNEAVSQTVQNNCRFIAYTYTEPTVFYEYMIDIARLAKIRGIKNTMHTCGYINQEPLTELLKYMDAVNVDLKGFSNQVYAKIGQMAQLEPVLETLKIIRNSGVWLEITCLLIPGLNDESSKIREMCEWIRVNLGKDVPVHFSRFLPAFRLMNLPPTPLEKLEEAYKIAKAAGLEYVYIGNVPGHPGESTYCPKCTRMIVKRIGYEILENKIKNGKCSFCGQEIAGRWDL
ncbi:MAG: AmmeMemoRadiSam system radical SAM enzyme [Candidatus Omnitrophica bacterium]|nr:AmmeMemoRadiSam system radical SAM enzyme [Candidatus Omnitrophota bacterium]